MPTYFITDYTLDSISVPLDTSNGLEISIKRMSSFSYRFFGMCTSQSLTKGNISKKEYTY